VNKKLKILTSKLGKLKDVKFTVTSYELRTGGWVHDFNSSRPYQKAAKVSPIFLSLYLSHHLPYLHMCMCVSLTKIYILHVCFRIFIYQDVRWWGSNCYDAPSRHGTALQPTVQTMGGRVQPRQSTVSVSLVCIYSSSKSTIMRDQYNILLLSFVLLFDWIDCVNFKI
jgi:hypothetical protein